jgi:hypothetical protein
MRWKMSAVASAESTSMFMIATDGGIEIGTGSFAA